MPFVLSSAPKDIGETTVLGSLGPVTRRTNAVAAGIGYFEILKKLRGGDVEETNNTEEDVVEEFPVDEIKIPTNINIDTLDNFDLYEILGLGSWASSVDCETIKKAYHKAVLLYHPDKQQNVAASEEDARTVFLKIQEANNTLSNESKRRAYDSQLDFDESVPSEEQTKDASRRGIEAFVELYDPVFKRNARFAVNKPVPGIGNAESSLNQVHRFYEYWIKFDSWRDFTNVSAEHNVDSADSREERRWMMKENERGAKKLKKKEMARVTEMVMRAMDYDPRLLQEKERIRLEKQAQRDAQEKKREEEAMRAALVKAEQQQKEEEEREKLKQQKLENEKTKKAASRGRNTFRKLLRAFAATGSFDSEYGPVSPEDVELLCKSLDAAEIGAINESLGGDAAVADVSVLVADDTALVAALQGVRDKEEAAAREEQREVERRREEEAARVAAAESKKESAAREWSREDLSTLSKALGKFPGGMKQRWVTICNYMNDILKPSVPFTRDECMKAANNAMQHLAAMKESGGIGQGFKKLGVSPAAAAPAVTASVPTTAAVTPPPPPSTAAPAPSTAAVSDEDASIWSQEQQKLLEAGLKKYPASLDKAERWSKIAGDVPGKNRKECISRYKQLREELQAKKSNKA